MLQPILADRFPLSHSAGQACPGDGRTVPGDDGQTFHRNAHARPRLSTAANVPWTYGA